MFVLAQADQEGSKGQRKSCVLRTITFCCVHALPLSFFFQGQVVLSEIPGLAYIRSETRDNGEQEEETELLTLLGLIVEQTLNTVRLPALFVQ